MPAKVVYETIFKKAELNKYLPIPLTLPGSAPTQNPPPQDVQYEPTES
jgi:hypothetical protein